MHRIRVESFSLTPRAKRTGSIAGPTFERTAECREVGERETARDFGEWQIGIGDDLAHEPEARFVRELLECPAGRVRECGGLGARQSSRLIIELEFRGAQWPRSKECS